MTSSFNRPMEGYCEGSGTFVSQPHTLEGVEHIPNEYVPQPSGSKVGNHPRIRASSHPHMSLDTQAMNPPFQ